MTRQDDRKIKALAKKLAAQPVKSKGEKATQHDPTLRIRNEATAESRAVFNEMKKREF
jgi:hypothetical protein